MSRGWPRAHSEDDFELRILMSTPLPKMPELQACARLKTLVL